MPHRATAIPQLFYSLQKAKLCAYLFTFLLICKIVLWYTVKMMQHFHSCEYCCCDKHKTVLQIVFPYTVKMMQHFHSVNIVAVINTKRFLGSQHQLP